MRDSFAQSGDVHPFFALASHLYLVCGIPLHYLVIIMLFPSLGFLNPFHSGYQEMCTLKLHSL